MKYLLFFISFIIGFLITNLLLLALNIIVFVWCFKWLGCYVKPKDVWSECKKLSIKDFLFSSHL